MPIDRSSYYPEVPGNDNCEGPGLNDRRGGLFDNDTTGPDQSCATESPSAPPPAPAHAHAETPAGTGPEPEGPLQNSDPATLAAHFLSWVLSPLLMPVYGIVFAFTLSILIITPLPSKWAYTGLVAGIDVLLPLIAVFVLKKTGVVSDYGLNNRKERLIPYFVMVLCYLATAWLLATKGAPSWLAMFFAGGAAACIINQIVNLWWKISAHAAGIAGIVALLIRIARQGWPMPALFGWIVACVALAGLLGAARVWLGRHTPWQVIAGFAVGFASVYILTAI